MIILNCEQGSPEWHAARAGVVTASMFSEVRKTLKSGPNKGSNSAAAKDYAFKLAAEREAGEPMADLNFDTFAMRRGRELEPEARLLHEEQLGMMIQHAGFVISDCGRFGASADGLIGDLGGSEYKCLIAPDRLRAMLVEVDPTEFMDQVQGCMWITNRQWWHLAVYCPALGCIDRALTVYEIERDDDYIAAMEADLVAFDRLVEENRELLRTIRKGIIPAKTLLKKAV